MKALLIMPILSFILFLVALITQIFILSIIAWAILITYWVVVLTVVITKK